MERSTKEQTREQAPERREDIANTVNKALGYYEDFSALPARGQHFVLGVIYGYNMAHLASEARKA